MRKQKKEKNSAKKILFITGTRADYGKIKSLMKFMDADPDFEVYIYVSGMHLLPKYGSTFKEVLKDGYENVHVAFGQRFTNNMSYNLGDVLMNLSGYVESIEPDMIVVHGDRTDALAGAIVGALNNIKVGHIEGGEISGTIDDSIRHAITKFAHLHFVANEDARKRLIQMGENSENIHIIGSPDIDIMVNDELPDIETTKKYYEIDFERYGVFMYHPVTTEYDVLGRNIRTVTAALEKSGKNYVVVYPNNDMGTEIVLEAIQQLETNPHFEIYPSIRFEFFLTLLKNADFAIGNSSAGVRETGIFGVPAIDIGSRQNRRYDIDRLPNIQHVTESEEEILEAIQKVDEYRIKCQNFGRGNSTEAFIEVLKKPATWDCQIQKIFFDME